MIVPQLSAADALALRHVRLEALRLHPEAFGSTFAEWQGLPASALRAADRSQIEASVIFGLSTEKGLRGKGGAGMLSEPPLRGGASGGGIWAKMKPWPWIAVPAAGRYVQGQRRPSRCRCF